MNSTIGKMVDHNFVLLPIFFIFFYFELMIVIVVVLYFYSIHISMETIKELDIVLLVSYFVNIGNFSDSSIWAVWEWHYTLNKWQKYKSFFKIENKHLFLLAENETSFWRRQTNNNNNQQKIVETFAFLQKTNILSMKILLKQFQIYYRLLENNAKTFTQTAIKINSTVWIEFCNRADLATLDSSMNYLSWCGSIFILFLVLSLIRIWQ